MSESPDASDDYKGSMQIWRLLAQENVVRILLSVLVAGAISACGPHPANSQMQTLPSGKQIKVLGIGKIFFTNDNPGLILKYQTDFSLDDKPALEREVDEIWASFRINVDNAGLSTGIISANEKPTGFIVTHSRGFNFVYKKAADGRWSRLKQ